MHNNKLYIIENLTSLHAGSGDANFGVIDNLIQRDAITNFPTIHSSSLKGALKEFMTHTLNYPSKTDAPNYNKIKSIFGDDDLSGNVRFMDAHLLAVPMRAEANPYYLCVSAETIRNYIGMATLFGINIANKDALQKCIDSDSNCILVNTQDTTIEGHEAKKHNDATMWQALESLIGEPVAIVPESIYKEFIEDLPVTARNQLDNGESKNLFYEEVLPRKSKFFTIISTPTYLNQQDTENIQNKFDNFHATIIDENNLIQIGANASIGYGVTKFSLGGES